MVDEKERMKIYMLFMIFKLKITYKLCYIYGHFLVTYLKCY